MSEEALRSFRTILRHLRKLPSHGFSSAPLRHVVTQFKTNRGETDAKKIAAFRATAHSYATLLSSVAELSALRALDTGDKLDPRDKIKVMARKVGLSVPKFSDEA